MNDFEVDLGDGRSVVVKAPDAQAAANAARQFMAREKEKGESSFLDRAGRYVKGALKSAGQGLTLGYGDEIGSAIDATLPGREMISKLRPISQAENWQQRYDENLARERGEAKRFSEENPGTATAANVAGNVAGAYALSGAPVIGAIMRGSPGLAANVAKGAVAGGVLGGAQGFGEGEGGFDARLKNAAIPALVGTAVGGAIPAIGSGVGYAYEKFAPSVLRGTANLADKMTPKIAPGSLSAAAPEGGMIPQESFAASLADASRTGAGIIEGDAATRRLALEIARSGGSSQARQKLADLGEGAFLADTSKGAGRLANLGAILPGEAGEKYTTAFGARNAQTGQRMLGAMGDQAKVPSTFDAQRFLEAYRSSTGSQLYDPVLRNGQFNVSPEMQELLKVPAIRETMEQITADATNYGVKLTEAEVAHLVKQTMNKNVDAAFQGTGKVINKDMVRQAGEAWERALWNANPAIKEADTAYAKVASLPDWLKRGGDFMKAGQGDAAVNVSPAALAADIPNATPEQLLALRVGSSNVMRDAATSGPESTRRLAKAIADNEIMQGKLGEIYGSDVADQLLRRSKAERTFAETQGKVLAGAQTAERLAAMADEGALTIPTGNASPISFLQAAMTQYQKMRQPSEAVRSRLADLLANPDAQANAETLRLIDAILKQQGSARFFSAGTSGAAGGSASSPR